MMTVRQSFPLEPCVAGAMEAEGDLRILSATRG